MFRHLRGEGAENALGGSIHRGAREIADGGQLDAWQNLQAGGMLRGDLPGRDEPMLS
jgi:hypothetical protein